MRPLRRAGTRLEFVDTNVLLYAYDASAGHRHERAAGLVGELGARHEGALSVQVLQEFYVNATRKLAEPLEPAVAAERVAVLARWQVHAPSAADVQAAIELHAAEQLSFWDAMIIRSAQALGCRVLWSEDLAAGREYAGVVVHNPFSTSPG